MMHNYFLQISLLLVGFNRFCYSHKKDSTNLKYEGILMQSSSPSHPVTARGDFIIKKLKRCVLKKMAV